MFGPVRVKEGWCILNNGELGELIDCGDMVRFIMSRMLLKHLIRLNYNRMSKSLLDGQTQAVKGIGLPETVVCRKLEEICSGLEAEARAAAPKRKHNRMKLEVWSLRQNYLGVIQIIKRWRQGEMIFHERLS